LSFDIVWLHWLFGLHHLTHTELDRVLEPSFVILGAVFVWLGIACGREQTAPYIALATFLPLTSCRHELVG
jgi:hypothetical protein